MSRVAVLQSCYLPWRGVFDIIDRVDTFVFYDDVQYRKNHWHNRNRILTKEGPRWLTVPVSASATTKICDVRVANQHWRRKHWQAIKQNYARAPFFDGAARFLEDFYTLQNEDGLSEINQHLTRAIASEFLGVTTELQDSRNYMLTGSGETRLLNLLQQCGASTYVSGPAAKSYINEQRFAEHGIRIEWMDYSCYSTYEQLHSGFEHHVSILDLILNMGPRAREYLHPQCEND